LEKFWLNKPAFKEIAVAAWNSSSHASVREMLYLWLKSMPLRVCSLREK
jgi:hypothetical protein